LFFSNIIDASISEESLSAVVLIANIYLFIYQSREQQEESVSLFQMARFWRIGVLGIQGKENLFLFLLISGTMAVPSKITIILKITISP